ncbi:hypothetical protein [Cohnella sp.]|uniref:hypothetical protein n=1 Tax=Cohnella sp. TaxID=1883426 RepID=UPI0035668889
MIYLLFLVIIPSAIGFYYLIKPPVDRETEADIKAAAPIAAQTKGLQEAPAPPLGRAVLLKQTANK